MAAALPLSGRVAIVTGASRGIGRAIASHLASLGASIVVVYASNSAAADQVAAELNSSSHQSARAIAVRADVSDADAVKSLFDAAESAFGGRAHILIACAGVLDDKYPTLAATTDEDWDRTFAVNTRGAFLCCREAANRLVHGGGGRIICITSSVVGALRPGYGAYVASKAAVEAMVKVLAKELNGEGAKGYGDHGQLRGAGAGGYGDVLRGEERRVGEEDSGGVSDGAVGGGEGHRAGGGIPVHRRRRVGERSGGPSQRRRHYFRLIHFAFLDQQERN